jgi:hypoxanthine phosphoribosyltransferase
MTEKIDVLISQQRIEERLNELAKEITAYYKGEELLVICILKGSIMVMSDLCKKLELPLYMDFMQVSSYGDDTKSSGRINVKKDIESDIKGKNVLVIEDIIDSGRTLHHLVDFLNEREPKSLNIFTLLDKPDRREFEVDVKWTCFEIPDEFVVGYGLDYSQRYRNIPYVGVLKFEE